MDNNRYYHTYDDETDRIPCDDDMSMVPEREYADTAPMSEEEARSYSSVYDIPLSSQVKKRPKQ